MSLLATTNIWPPFTPHEIDESEVVVYVVATPDSYRPSVPDAGSPDTLRPCLAGPNVEDSRRPLVFSTDSRSTS